VRAGGVGKENLTELFSSALLGVGWLIPHCAQPSHPPTHCTPRRAISPSEGLPSILIPVADGTDARRGLRISFVVLLHVWREEFRGDFAEGAKKLRR
jgi:hypothetical protein